MMSRGQNFWLPSPNYVHDVYVDRKSDLVKSALPSQSKEERNEEPHILQIPVVDRKEFNESLQVAPDFNIIV